MKISYIYFVLLFTGLFFVSCTKEIVSPHEETSGDPVFTVNALLGTDSVTAAAGVDDFYMDAHTISLNGITCYEGILSNDSMSLKMGMFSGNIDLASAQNPFNGVVFPQFLQYSQQPIFILEKEMLGMASVIQEVSWYIDGEYVGMNEVGIYQPGKYTVCADVLFINGVHKQLCNEMIIGMNTNANSMLQQYIMPGNLLKVWVKEVNSPVASVKWFVNDEEAGTEDKLLIGVDPESYYTVKAEITYANGVKRTKSMLVDGSSSGRNINDFSFYETASSGINDYKLYFELVKNYKHYFSQYADNSQASVSISGIEPYENSTSGNQVYKLTGTIQCNLKCEETGEIIPFVGDFVLGLGIN